MALSKIKNTGIADSSVTSANIEDGTIVNADINACAAIASSKLSGIVSTCEANTIEQNIALLGFKMAVNDGLTVFNLVDGVVDEFHDESGTDEGEGSNDTYCASNDNYINTTTTPYSAGFGYNHRTETDTSNPATNTYSTGIYTVPTGVTSIDIQAWGAGGGAGPSATTNPSEAASGGGGGYSEGTFAVTASQVLAVAIGQAGYPIHEPNESVAGTGGCGFRGAGNVGNRVSCGPAGDSAAGGGGASGVATAGPGLPTSENYPAVTAPEIVVVAGGGGGGGYVSPSLDNLCRTGGFGGGLVGGAGGRTTGGQTSANGAGGGGGDQEQGGTGGTAVNPPPDGNPGGFLEGGDATTQTQAGGGGEGYYGGGGGGSRQPDAPSDHRTGGGGSSYYGHPQVTSGSTEAGTSNADPTDNRGEGGGVTQPGYSNYCGASDGGAMGDGGNAQTSNEKGGAGHGYVLITGTGSTTASTTIVSNAFTASSAPTTSRIVVFQENVGSVTLNSDIVAAISRDGGSNFTNVTLADEGYITGASGQRILAGVATVSGQPSGTSMRWKITLANNQSKIHGVSLSWA